MYTKIRSIKLQYAILYIIDFVYIVIILAESIVIIYNTSYDSDCHFYVVN